MKRLSGKTKERLRRERIKELLKQKRLSSVARIRKWLLKNNKNQFSSVKIRLPSTVSLASSEARQALVTQLRKLKGSISDKNLSSVIIDLSKIKKLHPCGTLLFVAELERILQSEKGKKLSATYPQDTIAEQLFQHIGLLDKLGLAARVDKINADNVAPWLYVSGHEGDLDSISERLPKILTEGSNLELKMALLSGMAEAIANSSEHAYAYANPAKRLSSSSQKWWLFARQVEDDVMVLICDLGLGIPGTLEANWKDELAAYFKTRTGLKKSDHKMIELALKVGKTRTNQVHRGKGLKDILKVVKQQNIGSLGIYSNKGVYWLDNNNGSHTSHDEKNSIDGTIIQWKIPIDALGLTN